MLDELAESPREIPCCEMDNEAVPSPLLSISPLSAPRQGYSPNGRLKPRVKKLVEAPVAQSSWDRVVSRKIAKPELNLRQVSPWTTNVSYLALVSRSRELSNLAVRQLDRPDILKENEKNAFRSTVSRSVAFLSLISKAVRMYALLPSETPE